MALLPYLHPEILQVMALFEKECLLLHYGGTSTSLRVYFTTTGVDGLYSRVYRVAEFFGSGLCRCRVSTKDADDTLVVGVGRTIGKVAGKISIVSIGKNFVGGTRGRFEVGTNGKTLLMFPSSSLMMDMSIDNGALD